MAEARQAVEVLLPLWTEVGMDDALEMLGPGFEDGRVRAFAVKQLGRADDEVSLLKSSVGFQLKRRRSLMCIDSSCSHLRYLGTVTVFDATRSSTKI